MTIFQNLISADAFQRQSGISRTTLWRWRRDGIIAHQRIKGRVFYSKGLLEELVEAGVIKPPTAPLA